jgi:hypothetical protein
MDRSYVGDDGRVPSLFEEGAVKTADQRPPPARIRPRSVVALTASQ